MGLVERIYNLPDIYNHVFCKFTLNNCIFGEHRGFHQINIAKKIIFVLDVRHLPRLPPLRYGPNVLV